MSGTVTAVGSGAMSVGNRSLDGFTVLDQPNEVSSTLCASGAGTDRPSAQGSQEGFCVVSMKTDNTKANGTYISDAPVSYTLDTLAPPAVFPLSEQMLFSEKNFGGLGRLNDPAPTLDTKHVNAVAPAVFPLDTRHLLRDDSAFGGWGNLNEPAATLSLSHPPAVAPLDLRHLLRDDASFGGFGLPNEPVGSLTCGMTGGGNPPAMAPLSPPLYPRRLTPLECERLQGFPDGWTAIQFQGKPAKDSHRYRALGNSMAVPVMRWLAEGIREFF